MNSIRTPKEGRTRSSKRIAQAVDNEAWQEFRLSMKGKPTKVKLGMLEEYYHTNDHSCIFKGEDNCDTCIRIDNYIKALCRGGQLHPNESLDTAFKARFRLDIRR